MNAESAEIAEIDMLGALGVPLFYLFNLFNANTVLVRNNNILSTTFNQVVQNLSPRIVRFGIELGF